MSEENKVVEMQSAREKTPQEALAEQQRAIMEQAFKYATGTLELQQPIRARSSDVTQLEYDLGKVTGMEYVSAMDCDPGAYGSGRLSAKQALYLFSLAVEKCMKGTLDARDVRERMGIQDAIMATQIATIFFNASSRAGNRRITNA